MKKLTYLFAGLLGLAGCVSNDIPYPVIEPNVTALNADGGTASYDFGNRTVTLSFPEYMDLRNITVTSVTLEPEIAYLPKDIVGAHDLSSPLKFNIRTYDEYEWTLKAERIIPRYFTVKGQIGSSVIDEVNCRAVVMVGENVDVSNVEVTSLKLGPEGLSTYSLQPAQMKDFTNGIPVEVTAFDVTETWTLFVEVTDVSVAIENINPWTCEAYVTSVGIAGQENGFRYRPKGREQWTEVPEENITADGGSFEAHITDLTPESTYEVVAYCGTDLTEIHEFTTDPATQLPNHSFENVSLVTGLDYYKWFNPMATDDDGREMFWGTGNGEGPDGVPGTASLGIVLTYPETEDVPDGKLAVRCESKSFVGILACGNIFTGQFAEVVGTTGGKVHYGRPWTTRPKALKFKMKYDCGIVDIVGSYPSGEVVNIGDNDRCHIFATVGDWDYKEYGGSKDSPVLVNTTDGIYFTSESKGIIGYGEYIGNESTDGWIDVTIPIEYRSLTRKPTHIIVICATSIRGDYLTGSSKSTLWVDDFDLVY